MCCPEFQRIIVTLELGDVLPGERLAAMHAICNSAEKHGVGFQCSNASAPVSPKLSPCCLSAFRWERAHGKAGEGGVLFRLFKARPLLVGSYSEGRYG